MTNGDAVTENGLETKHRYFSVREREREEEVNNCTQTKQHHDLFISQSQKSAPLIEVGLELGTRLIRSVHEHVHINHCCRAETRCAGSADGPFCCCVLSSPIQNWVRSREERQYDHHELYMNFLHVQVPQQTITH